MRGKSRQRGYGPRGFWTNEARAYERSVLHPRSWAAKCRTTVAAQNGEDFSCIPEEWCSELVRVSRIVACKEGMFDQDEAADFCVYSVAKVLADMQRAGRELDKRGLYSVCYAYCRGVCRSLKTHYANGRTVPFDLSEHEPEVYDMLIDESAFSVLSPKARMLLNEAVMYAQTNDAEVDVTYTTKGNMRVRSTRRCEELSMFTVARLKLGWASSTASRVVNEIRDNFFPNYCTRMTPL